MYSSNERCGSTSNKHIYLCQLLFVDVKCINQRLFYHNCYSVILSFNMRYVSTTLVFNNKAYSFNKSAYSFNKEAYGPLLHE